MLSQAKKTTESVAHGTQMKSPCNHNCPNFGGAYGEDAHNPNEVSCCAHGQYQMRRILPRGATCRFSDKPVVFDTTRPQNLWKK